MITYTIDRPIGSGRVQSLPVNVFSSPPKSGDFVCGRHFEGGPVMLRKLVITVTDDVVHLTDYPMKASEAFAMRSAA
jgi:hypothetical protein